jgi:hypothetical protein
MNFRDIKNFGEILAKHNYYIENKKYNDEIIEECAKLYYKKMPPNERINLIAEKKQRLKYYDENEFNVLQYLLKNYYETKYTADILYEHISSEKNVIVRRLGLSIYNVKFLEIAKTAVYKYCEIVKNEIDVNVKFNPAEDGILTITFPQ